MMFTRLRERLHDGGFLIHAPGPNGDDLTLCGYAYEGSCTDGTDHGVEEVQRGKINCKTCIMTIDLCKSIPARMIARKP